MLRPSLGEEFIMCYMIGVYKIQFFSRNWVSQNFTRKINVRYEPFTQSVKVVDYNRDSSCMIEVQI